MTSAGDKTDSLYETRPLSAGHPDIEAHELATMTTVASGEVDEEIGDVLACLGRAIELEDTPKTAAVVGCGPLPGTVKRLGELGWECVGIEPLGEFAASACDYLRRPGAVLEGSAEEMPLETGSQSLVIMESVLEHVDSPARTLQEAYRVLAPGGVLYVCTTNRLKISNDEYTLRFFQWLPKLVKESYIHHHLHFDPELARYTSRPAVHWYTYAQLCAMGRTAGFCRFYSKLDLMSTSDAAVRRSALRRFALDRVRHNPWLRSVALTQYGGSIFMLKRCA